MVRINQRSETTGLVAGLKPRLQPAMDHHDENHRDTTTTTERDDTDRPHNASDARDEPETKGDKKPADSKKPGDPNSSKNKKPWYRRPLLVGLLMLMVIVGAVGGTLWWRHSRKYQSTDDATIDVVVQRVSPQIAGRVLRVLVNDNQDVAVGTVLVELDPADFQDRLENQYLMTIEGLKEKGVRPVKVRTELPDLKIEGPTHTYVW